MATEQKLKICKGTGDAKGFGCGELSDKRTFGLCPVCKYKWATTTEAGKLWFETQMAFKKKKAVVEEKKSRRKERSDHNISGAMKLADTYFSRYIRLKYSKDGKCTCYTCGKIEDITDMDNGHYQKRTHKATRYHENNCRPQDKTCNGDTRHNGKQDEFRVNLVNEIGEQAVVEIESLSRQPIRATTSFYREIADIYREKVNKLQKELKVKIW